MIAVACSHGALLAVVLLRVIIGLARGKRRLPAEPPSLGAAHAFVLVLVAAVVVLGLVVLHERLVAKVIPHATARGWVWFSKLDWINKEVVGERVYYIFLAAPVGVQLFLFYLLAGRWKSVGRPMAAALQPFVASADYAAQARMALRRAEDELASEAQANERRKDSARVGCAPTRKRRRTSLEVRRLFF